MRPATAGVIIVVKMRRISLGLLVVVLGLPAAAAGQPDGTAGAAYYFLLGREHEAAGDIEEAIAAHRQAIQLAPRSAELRAELAGLYARQERAADAVALAEEALTFDRLNREANRTLGSVYAALAEARRPLRPDESPSQYLARAITALERYREAGPSDIGVDLTLGRLYLQTGAYDKAIPLLRQIADDQPEYAEIFILLAAAEEGAGRTSEAVRALQQGLAHNPRFFRGFVRLAELSEKQGDWQQAADAYARAQQLNTRGVDFTPRRAAALINAGRPEDARDLLTAAVAGPDADPMLLYLYAAAQRRAGDLDEAEAAARRLRTAAPDDPRGMYVLAQVLEARGDVRGAEGALRDLIQKHPKDATALNYLGYMFAERGERLEEAVALVQRALEVDPGNPAFLDSLGWAYFQLGRFELADAPLTEAAEKMPNSSVVQDHLGDLRFRQERFAEAAAAWERSLAGDGDSIDRARIEKKIRDARSRMELP